MAVLTQETIKSLIRQLVGQANILTIPRVFVSFLGDHVSALLLSQILYWRGRCPSESGGCFYKSYSDWEVELGLSAYQVRRALEKLSRYGVSTTKRKVNGAPTLHYHVDEEIFIACLTGHLERDARPPLRNSKIKKLDYRETDKSDSKEISQSENKETLHSIKETKTTPKTSQQTTKKSDCTEEIFNYWRTVMEKPATTKLTRERRAVIEARLREGYTVEQIRTAINGCSKSRFHMGENDQGRRYDDLTLICRSGSKVEGFIQIYRDDERNGGQNANGTNPQRIVGEAAVKRGKYDHVSK